MKVESILKEFRKRRKPLENVNAKNVNPRIKAFIKHCKSVPEIEAIIENHLNRYPVPPLLRGTSNVRPPKAGSLEEIVSVGLYLMYECSDGVRLGELAAKHGIKETGTNYADDYVGAAMKQYIDYALNYIEEELEKKVNEEKKESNMRQRIRQKPGDTSRQMIESEDKNEEIKLQEAFIKFLREKKGYPSKSLKIEQMALDHKSDRRTDIIIVELEKGISSAIISFTYLNHPNPLMVDSARVNRYRKSINQADIPTYIVCPAKEESQWPFDIYEVLHNKEPKPMSPEDFPDYDDLIRKVLPDAFDENEIKREELINAFNNFLQYKKGFPENVIARDRLIDVDKPSPDIALIDPESNNVLALVEFSTTALSLDSLKKIAQEYSSIISSSNNPKFYFVELAEINYPEQFKIFLLSNGDGVKPIPMAAFPTFEELKEEVAGKKLTLSDFKVGLSMDGMKIFEKIIELAGDSNIGLHFDIVDESYINLRLSGLVDYRNNVVVQVHRYGERNTIIALAVAGPKKGTVWKEPELNDFITEGNVTKLSGYKKGIPGERAWLNGNLPKKGTREKAVIYVINPGISDANLEALGQIEMLLKWAVENFRREDEEWKTDLADPEREMTADEFYVADGKTKKDLLGFMPYVKAVAAFLTHAKTQPPLTMSVEGEWGSGKSSFMLQLQDEIKRINKEQSKGKSFIVEFEPWRHDKEEVLWAAFVLTFLKQIRGGFFSLRRRIGDWKLFWMRYRWTDGWIDVLRFAGFWVAFIVLCTLLGVVIYQRGMDWAVDLCESIVNAVNQEIDPITGESSEEVSLQGIVRWIAGGGGWVVLAGGIGSLLGLVKRLTGNPLRVNLKKYLKHPQYADRVSFIDQLHNDFKKIVSAYIGKKRIYIFIDDLDRCVIPKAAELMESINLMISDNPNLVFIMGMDREKVAAGLAVKHEKLLPYLSGWAVHGEVTDKDYDKTKRIKGIRYGYSFIEKFIQVPFVLPMPRQDRIKEMLLELAGQGSSSKSESKVRKSIKSSRISAMFSRLGFLMTSVFKTAFLKLLRRQPPSVIDELPISEKEREEKMVEAKVDAATKKVFGGDDENFRRIVQMVSPYLKYNPRRVKQFVNLFRLRYVTAMSTNLFEQEDGKQLTFEQLGKFVGIGLGWPLFIKDLERNYKLLDELVDFAEGKKMTKKVAERIKEWTEDEKLISLIKSGCFDEKKKKKTGGEYERFSMKGLDVEKLMKVAPRVEMSSADE